MMMKHLILFTTLSLTTGCMVADEKVETQEAFVPEAILLASEDFTTYTDGALSGDPSWDIEATGGVGTLSVTSGKITTVGAASIGVNVYTASNLFSHGKVEIKQRSNFDSSIFGAISSIGLRYRNNGGVAQGYNCIFAEGALNSKAGHIAVKIEEKPGGKEKLFNTSFKYDITKTYTFGCEYTINHEIRAFVNGVMIGSMSLYFPPQIEISPGYISVSGAGTQEISSLKVYHYTGKKY